MLGPMCVCCGVLNATRGVRFNVDSHHRYDSYTDKAWWYELVGFAEKIVLNGLASFITDPAAQITFALLAGAVLVMAQVHVNPFVELDLGRLGNVLLLAVFLTLVLGAHIELVGDGEWTADAAIVQNCLLLSIVACVLAGVLLACYDTLVEVRAMHDEHVEKYARCQPERKSSRKSAPDSPASSSAGASPPKFHGLAVETASRAQTSAAETPVGHVAEWAIATVAAGCVPLSKEVQRTLCRDLTRVCEELTRAQVDTILEQVMRGISYDVDGPVVVLPTPPEGTERLQAKCRDVIARAIAAHQQALPTMLTSLATLVGHKSVPRTQENSIVYGVLRPGVNRLSVLLVRSHTQRDGCASLLTRLALQAVQHTERRYLELTDRGSIVTPAGSEYMSPSELFLDAGAFTQTQGQVSQRGTKPVRAALVDNSPSMSMWYHPAAGVAAGAVRLHDVAGGTPINHADDAMVAPGASRAGWNDLLSARRLDASRVASALEQPSTPVNSGVLGRGRPASTTHDGEGAPLNAPLSPRPPRQPSARVGSVRKTPTERRLRSRSSIRSLSPSALWSTAENKQIPATSPTRRHSNEGTVSIVGKPLQAGSVDGTLRARPDSAPRARGRKLPHQGAPQETWAVRTDKSTGRSIANANSSGVATASLAPEGLHVRPASTQYYRMLRVHVQLCAAGEPLTLHHVSRS